MYCDSHYTCTIHMYQATGYVAMAGFLVLGLWIILTLIFRWNTYVASHMKPSEFDENTEK